MRWLAMMVSVSKLMCPHLCMGTAVETLRESTSLPWMELMDVTVISSTLCSEFELHDYR